MLGQSGQRVRDIAGQLPEDSCTEPSATAARTCATSAWLKSVSLSSGIRDPAAVRSHLPSGRSSRTLAGIDMGADQRGAKCPREAGSMAQHDVWLPVGHPDQNSALCLIVSHRLTPSASSPDPSAGSITRARYQRDLE